MSNIAVFPGSFDPITNGHIDLINRASRLFSKVIVAVAENKNKDPLFSLNQRVSLVEDLFKSTNNVEVCGFSSLLVDFAKERGAEFIIRGLRVISDFEYEFQLSNMNRCLDPNIETVFLTPSEENSFISSSIVKEVSYHEGDISEFVPENVEKALKGIEWP